MLLDLFAGVHVRDYETANAWYVRLLGSESTFVASDTEAVWQLAERRWLVVEQNAEHAATLCRPSSSTTSMPSSPRSPIAASSR